MSPPVQHTRGRPCPPGTKTGTAEASHASMRRELARAGLPGAGTGEGAPFTRYDGLGRPAPSAPALANTKARDPQANMRRQLARAGLAPA